MVNKPKNNIPDQKTLLAYLRGELSAKQQENIARSIEENPLLKDVVNGLRLSKNRDKNIEELEQKIRNKYKHNEGAKIISFQSKAILIAAASVLLLISFGIYNKMLKLDQERVVTEQTYKNEKTPNTELKSAEAFITTEEETADEKDNQEAKTALETSKEIPSRLSGMATAKSETQIFPEKNIQKNSDNALSESLADEAPVKENMTNTGSINFAEDKDAASKSKESKNTYTSDKSDISGVSTTVTSTVSTRDYPKREENEKKKTAQYRAAEQAPAATAEIVQEKVSAKKSLARPTADLNDPLNQAVELHNRNNYEGAFIKMDSLAQKHPNNDEYQYYAGVFAYDYKAYSKAQSYLEPLSKNTKSKFHESAEWYLALSYKASGKKNKAKTLLREIAIKNNAYQKQAADSLKALE
jgi:hypothetical protein